MRAVSAVIKHRNFDGNTYNHDIALLKLRKPVTFTKNIMPVCLPVDESDPSGKTGIAVGWGRTSEGGALPGIHFIIANFDIESVSPFLFTLIKQVSCSMSKCPF